MSNAIATTVLLKSHVKRVRSDEFDEIHRAAGNIKYITDEQLGCVDGLLVEDNSSSDPLSQLVAPLRKYLQTSDADVCVLMNASVMDILQDPNQLYAKQVGIMRSMSIRPKEQLTLEPYFQNCAVLVGTTSEK